MSGWKITKWTRFIFSVYILQQKSASLTFIVIDIIANGASSIIIAIANFFISPSLHRHQNLLSTKIHLSIGACDEAMIFCNEINSNGCCDEQRKRWNEGIVNSAFFIVPAITPTYESLFHYACNLIIATANKLSSPDIASHRNLVLWLSSLQDITSHRNLGYRHCRLSQFFSVIDVLPSQVMVLIATIASPQIESVLDGHRSIKTRSRLW